LLATRRSQFKSTETILLNPIHQEPAPTRGFAHFPLALPVYFFLPGVGEIDVFLAFVHSFFRCWYSLSSVPPARRLRGGMIQLPRSPHPVRVPTIIFMTDFGTANDAVAICKAVIVGHRARCPYHGHHPPGDAVFDRGRFGVSLEAVSSYYPGGTVFVGGNRPPESVPRAKRSSSSQRRLSFYVLPDNGLTHPRD